MLRPQDCSHSRNRAVWLIFDLLLLWLYCWALENDRSFGNHFNIYACLPQQGMNAHCLRWTMFSTLPPSSAAISEHDILQPSFLTVNYGGYVTFFLVLIWPCSVTMWPYTGTWRRYIQNRSWAGSPLPAFRSQTWPVCPTGNAVHLKVKLPPSVYRFRFI